MPAPSQKIGLYNRPDGWCHCSDRQFHANTYKISCFCDVHDPVLDFYFRFHSTFCYFKSYSQNFSVVVSIFFDSLKDYYKFINPVGIL